MPMTQRSLFSIPTEVVKFNLIKHFKLETHERAYFILLSFTMLKKSLL